MDDQKISPHPQERSLTVMNIIIKKEVKGEDEEALMEYLEGHKNIQPSLSSPKESHDVGNTSNGHLISHSDDPAEDKGIIQCSPRGNSIYEGTHHRLMDCSQEGHTNSHHCQWEEHRNVQVVIKEEEESHVRGDQQFVDEGKIMCTVKEEECLLGGHNVGNTLEGRLSSPSDFNGEGNVFTQCSPGGNHITGNTSTLTDGAGQRYKLISEIDKCSASTSVVDGNDPTGESPYICPQCGKSFISKGGFYSHQTSRTCENLFSCTECSKSYTQKKHFNRHMRTHTGERPFSCSECGKCFTVKEKLLRHRQLHTGERPFSCTVCGKSFTWKDKLDRHLKTHTDERPFSCSECGKSFVQKGYLTKHWKRHIGAHPFPCSECEKCFTEKSSLLRHHQTHHR